MCELRDKCADALMLHFGLDIMSLNVTFVDGAISQRVEACRCDRTSYLERVLDYNELASLHQLLLVSESWFCREMEVVEVALARIRLQSRKLSVLSVPCARGEEPISVFDKAMSLGFDPQSVTVHGYDISEAAIEQAKSFRFPTYSYRGVAKDFIERLFIENENSRVLRKEFTRYFRFERENIIAHDWKPIFPKYDLILCRNLLIYLDPKSQAKLIETLANLLSPSGLLVLGAAEGSLVKTNLLNNVKNSPVVFEQGGSVSRSGDELKSSTHERRARADSPRRDPLPRAAAPQIASACRPLSANDSGGSKKETALSITEMAQIGRFDDAYNAALEFLDSHPADAQIHAVLGVISISCGQFAQAKHWIAQALQLSNNDEEILHYIDSFSQSTQL